LSLVGSVWLGLKLGFRVRDDIRVRVRGRVQIRVRAGLRVKD